LIKPHKFQPFRPAWCGSHRKYYSHNSESARYFEAFSKRESVEERRPGATVPAGAGEGDEKVR
jgi:hypothetical protein